MAIAVGAGSGRVRGGKGILGVLERRECSFGEAESEFRKLQLIKRTECTAIYPPPRLLP
jgi:hypothetical protein